ncbi:MAG: alkaline phosphatase D family protein [Haliea sp.]|nr:alkaline phosphatase D family protein [Haliea sp.]
MLDYRLSNLVLPNLAAEQRNWSMDEIAQFDIPQAIARVCALTEHEKISVFGHCVGACTLAMAALRDADVGARIEAAVTNAIHPWVIASPANQFRAKLGNFYREWVPGDILDPNPAVGAGGLQNIVDRLAFSLARMNEGKEDDHLEYGGSELEHSICDRMSFLYGRMWSHKNLDPTTHAAFPRMLGPAPASVYQHLYYHSSLRRITDANGENTYLTDGNIRNHWQFPILFVHGNDSCVFNPHSARRSAYRLHGILNAPSRIDGLDTGAVERIPVRFKIYPDYGHMDVVFGKDAHKTCFQDYVDFLRAPGAVSNSDNEPDRDETYAALPVTGPILRAAWKEGAKRYIRLWAELRTNVTYQPDKLVVAGGQEIAEFELEAPEPGPAAVPRFRMIDVELKHTDAPIHLTLRGGIEDHDGYRGAELMYSEQAWWQRLRAVSGDQHQARMCFVVGSCRYPGSIVDNALSDKVYAAIQEHTMTVEGAQLLFLIGDQIYADATDQLIAIQSPKAKYTDRYRRAFAAESSPHFARLVAQIPTHFALDDHEKGDNWEGAPSVVLPDAPPIVLSGAPQADSDHHAYAINMAARFMGSGRNQMPLPGPTRASQHYYALSHPAECDFPTFVVDTRSERQYRHSNDPSRHCLMEPPQYKALVTWLLRAHREYPQAPKFIFSGSIIAPLPTRYCMEPATWRQQDGWAGYPATMEALLQLIAGKRIQKVVFVGGDAHLSAVSHMTLKQQGEASGTDVWQIVSSGLYAPLPFANAHVEDYLWSQPHALPVHLQKALSIECTNMLLSDHHSQFVRVDATVDQVTVTCFGETNKPLAWQTLFG